MRAKRTAASETKDSEMRAVAEGIIDAAVAELQAGKFKDYWCAEGEFYLTSAPPEATKAGLRSLLFTTADATTAGSAGHYDPGTKTLEIKVWKLDLEPCSWMDPSSQKTAETFARYVARHLGMSPRRYNMVVHELIHHLDFQRVSPTHRYKGYNLLDTTQRGRYFRDPLEFNAYYQQGASEFNRVVAEDIMYLPAEHRLDTFMDRFGTSASEFIADHLLEFWYEPFLDAMTEPVRRRFLKRVSDLYTSTAARLDVRDLAKVAMPYKTAPAISSKPYHDAVAADKWLRTNSMEERDVFTTAADYMSHTEGDAKNLVQYLRDYRYKVLEGPKKIREHFKKLAEESNNPYLFGYYADDLRRLVENADIKYVRQLLKYWKESVDRYIGEYYDGETVNYENPTKVKNLDELERYYEFSTAILPALETAVKLENALAAIEAHAFAVMNEYEYVKRVRYMDREEKAFPEGVEKTEVMWHVTTAYRKVMKEGFKTKDELYKETGRPAGLGGGQSDSISFTASYDHAAGIHTAILKMMDLAKHPTTAENLINSYRDMGMTEDGISKAVDIYYGIQGKLPDGPMPFDRARNLYEYLQIYAAEEGLSYSAVFWSPDEEIYAKLDPADVQIIEAVVDTTDPRITYHRAEEEWRIPVKSILSYGPVGSQKAEQTSKAANFLAAGLEDEGFVGQRWGSKGAGMLFTTGKRVLLLKRSGWVEEPGTWGISGGAVRRDRSTGQYGDLKEAARRESIEEMGALPPHRAKGRWVYSEPSGFSYTTFIGVVSERAADAFVPDLSDGESVDYVWFTAAELADIPVHFGVAALLDAAPNLVFWR